MFLLSFSGEVSSHWCVFVILKQKRRVPGVQECNIFCVKILQENLRLFIIMSL